MRVAMFLLALLAASCGDSPPGEFIDAPGRAIDAPADALANDGTAVDSCANLPSMQAASVRDFVETLAHGDVFASLTDEQLSAVGAAARSLLDDDIGGAQDHAALAGYQVTALSTPAECFLLLTPTNPAPAGQATLIVRRDWHRNLVIEAPHVPNDGNTDIEGAIVFAATGARALIVAGASRCASAVDSGCLASTECSSSGTPYESDPAHSLRTALHGMHLAIAVGAAGSLSLQLHTNLEPTLNGDARVSDGTKSAGAGANALAFYQALAVGGGDIRSCNDGANPPPSGAFCGTINAQGLATNFALAPACTRLATVSSDQFFHLEQASPHLRDELDAWSIRIAQAIINAFPATR
jgi:hypothetical protein